MKKLKKTSSAQRRTLNVQFRILDTNIDGIPGAHVAAFNSDDLIGAVTLSHLNSKTATITNLFVRLGYRRRGVAKRLLERCCAIARVRRCKTIGLSVQPKNEAQFFYPKVGFILAYEYTDKSMLFVKTL